MHFPKYVIPLIKDIQEKFFSGMQYEWWGRKEPFCAIALSRVTCFFCLYHMFPWTKYVLYVHTLTSTSKLFFYHFYIIIHCCKNPFYAYIYVRISWIIGKHSFLTNKCVTQNSLITQLYILSVHCFSNMGHIVLLSWHSKCPFICILQFIESRSEF